MNKIFLYHIYFHRTCICESTHMHTIYIYLCVCVAKLHGNLTKFKRVRKRIKIYMGKQTESTNTFKFSWKLIKKQDFNSNNIYHKRLKAKISFSTCFAAY